MNRLLWSALTVVGGFSVFVPTCVEESAFRSQELTVDYQFGTEGTEEVIRFNVTLTPTSLVRFWGAVGFSSSRPSGMAGIYSWALATSETAVKDMQPTGGFYAPPQDTTQNVNTISYANSGGSIKAVFIVPLNSGDTNDLVLSKGLRTNLVTAFGDIAAGSSSWLIHKSANRQSQGFTLKCVAIAVPATGIPTNIPTSVPTTTPTNVPTTTPTGVPTTTPTGVPATTRTGVPTTTPTAVPAAIRTGVPTTIPTGVPTKEVVTTIPTTAPVPIAPTSNTSAPAHMNIPESEPENSTSSPKNDTPTVTVTTMFELTSSGSDNPVWLPAFFAGVALIIVGIIGYSVFIRRNKGGVQFGKNINEANNYDNNEAATVLLEEKPPSINGQDGIML